MSELKPCPFPPNEIADILETFIPEIEDCMVVYAYQRSALHGAVAELRRAQPDNARPPCYLPEKDNPYPLCIGRGMTVCAHCCLWADYDQDENESRVNHPLTLEELRGMVGEWVWVEHMDSPASQAAPGEWLKLKTCEPTRLDPHIRFEGKGLCALYYGQSWLAYRRPPERSENE